MQKTVFLILFLKGLEGFQLGQLEYKGAVKMRNPFFKRRGKKPKTTTKDQVLLLFFSDSKWLKANTGDFFNYASFVCLFKAPQAARVISGTRQRWLLEVTLVLRGRLLGAGIAVSLNLCISLGNWGSRAASPVLSLPTSPLSLALSTEQKGAPSPTGFRVV